MRLGVAKTITTIAKDTTTGTTIDTTTTTTGTTNTGTINTTTTDTTTTKRRSTTTSRMSHQQPQQRLAIVLAVAVLACLGTPVTHAARRSRIDQAAAAATAATPLANGVDNAAIKDDQQPAAPLPLIAASLKEPATDQSSEADAAAAVSAPVDGDDTKGLLDATDIQTARAQPAAQVSALEDSSADVSASVSSAKQSGEQLTASAAASGEPKEAVSSDLSSGEDVDLDSAQQEQQQNNNNNNNNNAEYCDPDMTGFEIITGYVFSAPDKLLDSLPGTLMLTDCLEACQNNETCHAVNYETGLCVLFSSNADRLPGALTKSQFPVFTIYAQKSCLGVRPCARAWCVDRVQNYKLKGLPKRTVPVTSRRDCLELCLGETEFTCRSANYHRASNTCDLSEMDRITLAGSSAFQPFDGIDYLENNCAEEPNKLCEFKRLSGRILKTVDSVYQDVGSIDECRDLCLNSPYRCHSYDYGDTGDMVCRLSHHSRSTLSDVQDPYLEVPEAATYELSSCYNVTIECGAGDMIARIRTSKLFDGKVYAKGSPKSCAIDVKSALDFELRMGYQDLECNVRQSGSGRYMNDVVIQHHDTIVTSSDLGLAVTCQYDLTNKSVTNDVDLGVKGDIEPALSEEVIVDSPNVIMKITSRDGSDVMRSAEVGDPLALKFEIIDEQSPYEIFVRELVAMDGADNAEITLIDSRGCPTDHFIMGPIYKSSLSGKVLLSHFDAFKFPSSEVVQFRALVTPCMPSCEPVQCDQDDIGGEFKSLSSYGRRRRSISSALEAGVAGHDKSMWLFTSSRLNNGNGQEQQQQVTRSRRETTNNNNIVKQPSQEDLLLVQSIQITDKFGFDKQQQQQPNQKGGSVYETNETVFVSGEPTQGFCVNAIGLVVAGTVFLLAQLAVISIWTYIYQRRRKQQPYVNEAALSNSSSAYGSHSGSSGSGSTVMSGAPNGRTESLCKLYDGGFGGRHGRQF